MVRNTTSLHNLKEKNLTDLKVKFPKKTIEIDRLLEAYYCASKYLCFNNKNQLNSLVYNFLNRKK